MKMNKKFLLSTTLCAGLLAIPHQSFALGGGGEGANVPSDTVNVTGLGPLSGQWTFMGGVDAYASTENNATPRAFSNEGSIGPNAQYSIGLAAIQIHKASGWLHFTYWGGSWQTPTVGITTDNGAFNSLDRLSSGGNPLPSPTFKWWFTAQPSQYWSVSAGELASLEGTEIGFDWMNPTPFVSNLNNMQITPGYGGQINLFYGPSTLNVQYSDGYHTARTNMLSFLYTYNLNASGSDNAILFGHTNLGHTGNSVGPNSGGFAAKNSTLIGAGAQWVFGPWTVIPEAEYQYLPKSSVTAASGDARPMTTYYNLAAMTDVTYQFTPAWSLTAQPEIVYQNGDKADPNQYAFGNWLQFGAGPNVGTFSPGTTLTALQVSPTWDDKNVFIRPSVMWTHLAGVAPGTAYGKTGNSNNQFVGLVEVGLLLGS